MKKTFLFFIMIALSVSTYAQMHTEQNGLKTTVTNVFSASDMQAKRFEIAAIGYNIKHWQFGGLVIIELFDTYYGTGYEKYIVENGYLQGATSGEARLRLVSSFGKFHNARIVLGTPRDVGTTYADVPNKALPVYLDVREYTKYAVRITYMQDRVSAINYVNQISLPDNPVGVNIPDFAGPTAIDDDLATTGLLRVSGNGNHYIQNGNVGIGTSIPDAKLTVNGSIHAKEVKVDLSIPAPDYVFEDDYKLLSLRETADFIKINKHLPEIPSAKIMEQQGVNVSELQMKLLQKIEEITLHMISQQELLDKQTAALEKMQQYISTLKKK